MTVRAVLKHPKRHWCARGSYVVVAVVVAATDECHHCHVARCTWSASRMRDTCIRLIFPVMMIDIPRHRYPMTSSSLSKATGS